MRNDRQVWGSEDLDHQTLRLSFSMLSNHFVFTVGAFSAILCFLCGRTSLCVLACVLVINVRPHVCQQCVPARVSVMCARMCVSNVCQDTMLHGS